MGEVKYLTGAALSEGGGTQVLQEACICGRKSGGDVQVILACVFAEHGDIQHRLAVEIGEWFQNTLVPMIKNNGTDSLINICINGIVDRAFSDRINTTEYVCAIFAGESIVLFKSGCTTGIYSIEDLFGKPMAIPMEPGNAGIMVTAEHGGSLVLTDCDITGDKFFVEQIAAGISAVTDEKGLNRFVGEIAQVDGIECKSLVGIRFL